MLAGLIARMILLPNGPLAETASADRIVGAVIALAIFFLTRRNIGLGVAAGAGALVLITWGRALLYGPLPWTRPCACTTADLYGTQPPSAASRKDRRSPTSTSRSSCWPRCSPPPVPARRRPPAPPPPWPPASPQPH